mmetsp:Transcript_8956/g.12975  ORF Transcript_8956/g.12975 Transcript_8956/m.12975 type:complete len:279 (-) Transcript_8956:45-881(-)
MECSVRSKAAVHGAPSSPSLLAFARAVPSRSIPPRDKISSVTSRSRSNDIRRSFRAVSEAFDTGCDTTICKRPSSSCPFSAIISAPLATRAATKRTRVSSAASALSIAPGAPLSDFDFPTAASRGGNVMPRNRGVSFSAASCARKGASNRRVFKNSGRAAWYNSPNPVSTEVSPPNCTERRSARIPRHVSSDAMDSRSEPTAASPPSASRQAGKMALAVSTSRLTIPLCGLSEIAATASARKPMSRCRTSLSKNWVLIETGPSAISARRRIGSRRACC